MSKLGVLRITERFAQRLSQKKSESFFFEQMKAIVAKQRWSDDKTVLLFLLAQNSKSKSPHTIQDLYRQTLSLITP
jgi:hypothetical protein